MRFGTREKVTSLGRFTSDKCRSCKSVRYRMEKKVRYAMAFGFRIIPMRVRYYSVCERCGAEEPVGSRTARYLARKHFRGAQMRHQFSMALRTLIVAAIVVGLVSLPMAIRIPVNRDPEVLKSLVSADGDYIIKDSNDEMLAIIHVEDGVKSIPWYDQMSELKDTGSRGGRFYLHEAYLEAVDSAGNTVLVRYRYNPGWLTDQYHTNVRQYYYNEETDALDYYRGAEDLSAIQYTSKKVTYPSVYINENGEKQQYMAVLYLSGNTRLRAQFIMSSSTGVYDRLVTISIETLSGTRVTDQTDYYFDATQVSLTPDSVAQDFADFLTANAIEPGATYHFEYYGNTRVVLSQTTTEPDAYGYMQTTTMNYTVTAKRGYYIVQLVDSTTEAD